MISATKLGCKYTNRTTIVKNVGNLELESIYRIYAIPLNNGHGFVFLSSFSEYNFIVILASEIARKEKNLPTSTV